MISLEALQRAQADCKKAGHTVSARDISYAILTTHYEDSLIAYRCIFGKDYDYNEEYHTTYDQTAMMVYLKQYVEMTLLEKKKVKKTEDISFEENKAYMLQLKKQTEEAMANGDIDKKDGLKILAQISTTLNDKFKVKDEATSQVVVVNHKYDDLCPRCLTEIARRPISKEEAMEMYNLCEID